MYLETNDSVSNKNDALSFFRFSRAQRVTVCMALLYLFFMVNAMFYGLMPGRNTEPYISIGVMDFDSYTVR